MYFFPLAIIWPGFFPRNFWRHVLKASMLQLNELEGWLERVCFDCPKAQVIWNVKSSDTNLRFLGNVIFWCFTIGKFRFFLRKGYALKLCKHKISLTKFIGYVRLAFFVLSVPITLLVVVDLLCRITTWTVQTRTVLRFGGKIFAANTAKTLRNSSRKRWSISSTTIQCTMESARQTFSRRNS